MTMSDTAAHPQGEPEIAAVIALRRQGIASCRERRFDLAAKAFSSWAALTPGEATPILYLARCQALAGRLGDGRQTCERAITLQPSPRAYRLLARIAERTKNGALRLTALENAVLLSPDAVALRLALVRLMLRRNRFKAAMATAREAVALAPSDLAAQLALARCHAALGQMIKARAILEQAEASGAEREGVAEVWTEISNREERLAAAPAPVAAAGQGDIMPAPAPSEQPPVPPPLLRRNLSDIASPPERSRGFHESDADVEGQIDIERLRSIEYGRPRRGLIDHLLIIRSLILRELRVRHRDSSLGALVELFRPTIVVVVHYWMFYLLRKPMPAQIPIEPYVLAGFTVWFAFSGTLAGALKGGKWPGGATSFPGVTNLHMRVARAVWELMVNLVFCLAAFLPLRLYGRVLPLPDVPATCLVFIVAGAMGFGLGLLIDRLGTYLPLVKTLEKILTWALFVTSGLYFSMGTLPAFVANWFWYNPLLHLVELERNAFDPGYPIAQVDERYPVVVMAALLVTGLLAYGSIRCPTND